jgi:hypothetical protein
MGLVRQPNAGVNFINPVRDYEFGFCAGILKQFMGARNRVGMGLSYGPAKQQSLAELVPSNRFLGSLKV